MKIRCTQQLRNALIKPAFLMKNIYTICFLLLPASVAFGQTKIPRDSITRILKSQPSFSVYKDNYFITGTTVEEKPSNYNSDIKMQISFKQRLSNSIMPFKSYLYLTYSQKSFWKIYQHSSPFEETIFNPGIGLGKFIFKDGRHIGFGTLQLEHESNGTDSIFSRSWNSVSVSYLAIISKKFSLIGKFWIPFSLSDNTDLTDYIGYGEITLDWEFIKNKFDANIIIRKGAQVDLKGSFQTNIYYNPFKNANQYFYLQIFNGYAENLINYNRLTNMIRLGICIRPNNRIFKH